jgi:hypothetical protein
MKPNDPEVLHTYQDLMARFRVCYATVWRWFRWRRKFKPTCGTVRISESEVQLLIQDKTKKYGRKK